MRHLQLIIILIFFSAGSIFGQIPVEVLVGDEQLSHDFFFFKDLDEKQRYNIFTQGRFTFNYEDEQQNSSLIATYLTRNLTKNWGISVGASSSNLDFTPLVAVSFAHFSQDGRLFINLFPSLLLGDQTSVEMSGLFIYRPKISKKWSSFNQLLFATNLNPRDISHQYSVQQFRLGLDYNNKIQFGIGADFTFLGSGEVSSYSDNIGLFIRTNL